MNATYACQGEKNYVNKHVVNFYAYGQFIRRLFNKLVDTSHTVLLQKIRTTLSCDVTQ